MRPQSSPPGGMDDKLALDRLSYLTLFPVDRYPSVRSASFPGMAVPKLRLGDIWRGVHALMGGRASSVGYTSSAGNRAARFDRGAAGVRGGHVLRLGSWQGPSVHVLRHGQYDGSESFADRCGVGGCGSHLLVKNRQPGD